MNTNPARDRFRSTTRAAEGLPRWRWTTAEIERIAALGAFDASDRFKLIGGEIVPMSPKGNFHENLRTNLSYHLTRLAPPTIKVAYEPQFNLAPDTYTEPDILVYPADRKVYDVDGPAALLVIETADSSASYDLGSKAALFARHGVREYWVIHAVTRTTTVHRDPGEAGNATISTAVAADRLVPVLVPDLAVVLSDPALD
jgi:Uma2 family endonuclease